MLTIKVFNTGAAFDEPRAELARILRTLADRIENQNAPGVLHDINGNICGIVDLSALYDLEGDA